MSLRIFLPPWLTTCLTWALAAMITLMFATCLPILTLAWIWVILFVDHFENILLVLGNTVIAAVVGKFSSQIAYYIVFGEPETTAQVVCMERWVWAWACALALLWGAAMLWLATSFHFSVPIM